ncbi:MAG: dTMP kinase [Burkholderiaceae bacterium]|nr:dTMP kinase [Burkholderiaceae bacterium]
MRGRFVTFEGIDGAGKSTHLAQSIEWLRARGHEVLATREPGGTELAEALRELLLHRPMSLETELMLVFAARRDHLEHRIVPALERGAWVVCDRFTDSTWAYQGAGRGAAGERIAWLESWVHGTLQPTRTYWFDVAPEVAAQRRARSRQADRFESEDLDFFRRVRDGYRRRTEADPERIVRIDGSGSVEQVRAILEEDLARLCSS